MTNKPHCPHCNSMFYAPDPSSGGHGRNKCLECGKASQVALWYQEPARSLHMKGITTEWKPGVVNRPAAPIRAYKDD